MKISFFGSVYDLDDLESETLKVALLDALKYSEEQRNSLSVDSKEVPVFLIKLSV